jgi:hypothetical protein
MILDPDYCIRCGGGPQLRDLGGDQADDQADDQANDQEGALCLRCALERAAAGRSELPAIADRTPESR